MVLPAGETPEITLAGFRPPETGVKFTGTERGGVLCAGETDQHSSETLCRSIFFKRANRPKDGPASGAAHCAGFLTSCPAPPKGGAGQAGR